MKNDNEIGKMQDILPIVRGAMGWSAEELGNRIGVTRQTINNIERRRTDLSKTQYIAIRSVIDAEIAGEKNCDSEMVKYLLDAFVDRPEGYSDEQKEQMLAKARLLIPAILADSSTRKEATEEWLKTVGLIAGAVLAAGASALWISKLIRSK